MTTCKPGLQTKKGNKRRAAERANKQAKLKEEVLKSQELITEATDEFLARHHTPSQLRSLGILPLDEDDLSFEDALAGVDCDEYRGDVGPIVTTPLSQTHLRPDTDRRALIDAWLESKAEDEAA